MSKHRGHKAPPKPESQKEHTPRAPKTASADTKTWSAEAVRRAADTVTKLKTTTSQTKETSMNAAPNQNNQSQRQSSNSNNFQQNAQNAFQNAQNAFQNAFQNMQMQTPFSVEEMAQAARANADAALQSFNTMTNGMAQINQQMVSLAQNLSQMAVAAVQAATSARTLREIADLQNDFAKTSFDTMVSRGTEISEQALRVANDASQPISQRINETMERMNRAA